MKTNASFNDYVARLRQFMHASMAEERFAVRLRTEAAERQFNLLALRLFALQFQHNPVYRKFCLQRSLTPNRVLRWQQLPALPTVAFKELEVTSLPADDRPTVFYSSGTAGQRPSRHYHHTASLAVYEASLLAWFRPHFETDPEIGDGSFRANLILLTPPPAQAPQSSLVHMLDTVRRHYEQPEGVFTGSVNSTGAWEVNLESTLARLDQAANGGQPVALLGAAFNFVHLLDHLASTGQRYALPAGSRIMETGGYKGRSRFLPQAELHALLTHHLGVPPQRILCEYGMSELSSQAYDLRMSGSDLVESTAARAFAFPPWARLQLVSPETGREVDSGEIGLIRVVDLANVRSVLAVQTEDLARQQTNGFVLLGRAPQAESRGCSLMATETFA